MLGAGLEAIVGLGGAKPGDKTLVDVLHPAVQAFVAAVDEGRNFEDCLRAMQQAAAEGLASTEGLLAKLGRAARLGERSRGTLDAGAASCNLLLSTLADGLLKRLQAQS